MKACFKILIFNFLHVLVIAPLLVFVSMAAYASFIVLTNYPSENALWILFVLMSFLLGWLARFLQLRAPFFPATLMAGLMLGAIGVFEDELLFWVFLPSCWAGFSVPSPARSIGLWDTSMPWVAHRPFVVLPLSLVWVIASFWVLDGIHVGFGVGPSDGGIVQLARMVFHDAFTEAIENDQPYMRMDERDFSELSTALGGVYVRKGEIMFDEIASDSLILIFDESRSIQSGGSLFSRRIRPMHSGLAAGGGAVRLTVAEYEALDLSDFVYRPLQSK